MKASLIVKGLALLALLGVLTGLWLGVTGHYVDKGVTQERARWQAAELVKQRQADADHAENTRLGQRAAEAALANDLTERTFADQLTQERHHATLVYQSRPPRPDACAVGPVADRGERRAAGPGDGESARPSAELASSDALASVHLSADAVRLWNAALAGPGGAAALSTAACGADAAARGACDVGATEDSGITLDEAWDNQATNALSCRIDRGRHRQLIELLRAREAHDDPAAAPLLTNRN